MSLKWIKVFSESPIPSDELAADMEVGARPSVGYYLLLILSASLATLGLISDSTAVIIGAMIIAPLMNPIMACSYAVARRNGELLQASLFSILTGIAVVILVAGGITHLVGYRMLGNEAIARSNPSLIDLAIAVASGTAGAFAWTRKRIANAIPGVAIAVALVPPLCVGGMGFALGDSGFLDPSNRDMDSDARFIERGALLLFLTNFAAIVLCSCLVFLVQGYGRWIPAALGIGVMMSVLALITVPLGFTFGELRLRSLVADTIVEMSPGFPNWKEVDLSRIRVLKKDQSFRVELFVSSRRGMMSARDTKAIEKELSKVFGVEVDVMIYLTEYEMISSGPEEEEEQEAPQ